MACGTRLRLLLANYLSTQCRAITVSQKMTLGSLMEDDKLAIKSMMHEVMKLAVRINLTMVYFMPCVACLAINYVSSLVS